MLDMSDVWRRLSGHAVCVSLGCLLDVGVYWTAMNRLHCDACPHKNSDHIVRIKLFEFSENVCFNVFRGWVSSHGQWHWQNAYPLPHITVFSCGQF